MEQHPLVSIIVPVYNTASYLERCVDSLLAQTYDNFELILVNDGSTDESGNICDRYAMNDERITSVHQKNSGPMAACRYGAGISKGTFLCFVDSDDWIDNEMLSAMAAKLRHNVSEIVCCNIVTERANGIFYERHGLAPGVYEGESHNEIFRSILGNENRLIILSRCMKLISRELIIENLIYCDDGLSMGEDAMMVLAALFDSKRIVIMEDAFYYHYFYNTSSLVHAYRADLYQQMKRLQDNFQKIMSLKIEQNKLAVSNQEMEAQCAREHLYMLMFVIKEEARDNSKGSRYRKTIMEICRNEKTREVSRKYPLIVSGLKNRILYFVLKQPGLLSIFILRVAAIIFYARHRGNQ